MKGNIKANIKDPDLIEKKRNLIIKGANKLFVKKGFHKTKTIEIAKESGLTEGTIYNYIRKKEDILFLLHEQLQKKFIGAIESGIQKGEDIQSRTENVFNDILDLIEKHLETCRLIYIETANQARESLKVLLIGESEIIKQFCDLITIGVKQNVFHVESPRMAASIVHFLIFYQSLNNWDIKRMKIPVSEVKRNILLSIYRILGYENGAGDRQGNPHEAL
ncbi:MAG: TetR/AcrR family transcriptional regulator [Deltaproteobacteria bacterium]|nr:TetR/AcrR family transcriptional regulator [Deltaproteobacteria bacterium]